MKKPTTIAFLALLASGCFSAERAACRVVEQAGGIADQFGVGGPRLSCPFFVENEWILWVSGLVIVLAALWVWAKRRK